MGRQVILLTAGSLLVTAFCLVAGPKPRPQATEIPSQASALKTKATKGNPKDGLNYVWIPAGTFQMGCSPGDDECNDEEKPPHQVTISKGFWMGQTEVTVGAYKRFTQRTGKSMPPEPKLIGRALNPAWNNNSMPMVAVSWDDAHSYCAWMGGRLPTEAEWEYAARGGSVEARYGPTDEIAWDADNSGRQRIDSARAVTEHNKTYPEGFNENGNAMHEVAQKRPNGFGLFDTLGNAWEWVNDWYDDKYYQNGPATDPQGPSSGEYRVLRGGSWLDPPWDARVSYRGASRPDFGYAIHGFRCVWEAGGR